MGDIGTLWFVATDDETPALWSVVSSLAVNPFTKEQTEITALHLHPDALAARAPSYARDGLMAEDVADLLYLNHAIVGLDVGEDELYRVPDDGVNRFAKIAVSEFPKRLATWKARLLRRGVPMASADRATLEEVTKLHGLAVHAVEQRGSLYGWVQFSGR